MDAIERVQAARCPSDTTGTRCVHQIFWALIESKQLERESKEARILWSKWSPCPGRVFRAYVSLGESGGQRKLLLVDARAPWTEPRWGSDRPTRRARSRRCMHRPLYADMPKVSSRRGCHHHLRQRRTYGPVQKTARRGPLLVSFHLQKKQRC